MLYINRLIDFYTIANYNFFFNFLSYTKLQREHRYFGCFISSFEKKFPSAKKSERNKPIRLFISPLNPGQDRVCRHLSTRDTVSALWKLKRLGDELFDQEECRRF